MRILNTHQKRRRSAGFAAMSTKRAPKRSRVPRFNFIPIAEPHVIIQDHPTGARPAMAISKDGKLVPICRWPCRHLNTRQNRDYIPPRSKR